MAGATAPRKVLDDEEAGITVVMEISQLDVIVENNDPAVLQQHTIDNMVMIRRMKVPK